MITANDIIRKLIKEKGYKSCKQFCEKNLIDLYAFYNQLKTNSWNAQMLEKISKALNENLLFLTNSKRGK